MTIAIIQEIFLPTVNGVVTTSINLAENLRKRGYKVIFIAPSWNIFKETEVNGIPIFYIPSLPTHMYPGIRLISLFNFHMRRIIKEQRVDIVHITGPWLLARSAIKVAKQRKIPVVQTFHTLIYEDTYLYYGLKSRALVPFLRILVWKYIGYFIKRSDIMTAPSSHACETLREHFPDKDIRHIRNGIELADFQDFGDYEALDSRFPGFNRKSFIFVGRLGEEKSVSVLIESFRLAQLQDAQLKLFIVGDGPGRKAYEKTVHEENLEDSVFFLGRMDHKDLITSGLYHHARALVTASTTENQPITVIEAIACNTPIIIPEVDGIRELLHENGLFFKADDTVDFSEKILEMAHDDQVFDNCKKGGSRLKKEFDGMKIAAQFDDLYSNVPAVADQRLGKN